MLEHKIGTGLVEHKQQLLTADQTVWLANVKLAVKRLECELLAPGGDEYAMQVARDKLELVAMWARIGITGKDSPREPWHLK